MLTVGFIILKLTDVLLLNWWWIISAILVDIFVEGSRTQRLKNEYQIGYEEGYEERGAEILEDNILEDEA